MGVKVERKKPRNFLLSFLYRAQKLIPLSGEKKFRLFLDLEWIFDRLAHEASFKHYSVIDHPFRIYSRKFLLSNINPTDRVLDLGCHFGDISFFVAEKAKEVIGIDHNAASVQTAKARYQRENLTFVHAEAFDYLSKNENKFNVLILSHILEHLHGPEEFLKKFKGFFQNIYIEVPDFDRYQLNHYRKDLGVKLIYSDDDHVSEFDRDEVLEILKASNIEVLRSEWRHGVQRFWCKVL
jgi:SAM-dependent methyltransferase